MVPNSSNHNFDGLNNVCCKLNSDWKTKKNWHQVASKWKLGSHMTILHTPSFCSCILTRSQATNLTKICEFFNRLLARGYIRDKLLPIFAWAEENTNGYINWMPAEKEAPRKMKLLESHKFKFTFTFNSIQKTHYPEIFKNYRRNN
jgi:hypothetical protein